MKLSGLKGLYLFLYIIAVLFFVLMSQGCDSPFSQKVPLLSEYHAVFLSNGQVFFGKAELGSDFISLSDVYYIQSQVNQETDEVKNELIKRGKEWHAPDKMYINKSHVVLIEPVAADSQVAMLIKEAKEQ